MSDAPPVSDASAASAFRRNRWLLLYLPIAVAALLVAAYGFFWMRGAETMRGLVEDWAEDQRENGLVVSYNAISTAGFPFFLRAHVNAVEIADPGRWRWRAESLDIDALPYALDRLIFSPRGAQNFESPEIGAWRAAGDTIRASVAADSDRGWLFSLEVLNGAARSETGAARISASQFLLDAAPNATDPATIEASLRADAVAFEDGSRAVSLSRVGAALGFSQTAPGDGAGKPTGALRVRRLGIETGKTRISAAGVLHLDAEGYPAGAIDAEIENPAGLAELLGGAGVLEQAEADAVGTGLALAALPTGGKLAAPIVFRDGEASIARFKLADLPKVE